MAGTAAACMTGWKSMCGMSWVGYEEGSASGGNGERGVNGNAIGDKPLEAGEGGRFWGKGGYLGEEEGYRLLLKRSGSSAVCTNADRIALCTMLLGLKMGSGHSMPGRPTVSIWGDRGRWCSGSVIQSQIMRPDALLQLPAPTRCPALLPHVRHPFRNRVSRMTSLPVRWTASRRVAA